MTRVATILAVLALASVARAQHPPMQGDPHEGVDGAPHHERQIATAEASASVPRGTIRVHVVDGAGAPVPGAEVNVGIMGHEGRRDRIVSRADATGVATFAGLDSGTDQAYRVNVPSEGATYSSTPFQLPPNVGYDVHVTRLPITRDDRVLLQLVDTQIELREDRAHVTQRVQLINLGERTYVFPVRGVRYELPHGALAFQTEPVMTDQHVAENAGVVEIHGSLPPGGVNLPWAFDVPLKGAQLTLSFPQHVRTYQWRVITDAPDGLRLDIEAVAPGDVEGGGPASQFSDPEPGESDGRSVLFSELSRTPQDPPLRSVEVHLSGIPTPGPLRWLAIFAVVLLLAGAIFLATMDREREAGFDAKPAREQRKKELLAEAQELGREREKGEVGPKYYARRRGELVAEMSLLLRADEEGKAAKAAARAIASKAGVRKPESRASRSS